MWFFWLAQRYLYLFPYITASSLQYTILRNIEASPGNAMRMTYTIQLIGRTEKNEEFEAKSRKDFESKLKEIVRDTRNDYWYYRVFCEGRFQTSFLGLEFPV